MLARLARGERIESIETHRVRKDGTRFYVSMTLSSVRDAAGNVIGASAIDEDGALLDFDYREVQAAQAIIANARHVILVADSTKFRRTAPVRIGHISQVQTFVTDRGLPVRVAKIAQDCGVTIIEAMDKLPYPPEEPSRDYPQAAS